MDMEDDSTLLEPIHHVPFPGELHSCHNCPFFDYRSIYLYGDNKIVIIDDNKPPEKVEINTSRLSEDIKFNQKHRFELLDSFYLPNLFLMSNFRTVC